MSFAFFKVPAAGCSATEKELNQFLNQHKVLSVDRRWVDSGETAYWAICIDYLESTNASQKSNYRSRERIDYREKLSEQDFAIYLTQSSHSLRASAFGSIDTRPFCANVIPDSSFLGSK